MDFKQLLPDCTVLPWSPGPTSNLLKMEGSQSLTEGRREPIQPMFNNEVVVILRTSGIARIPIYAHFQLALNLQLVMVHPSRPANFTPYFKHWVEAETDDIDRLDVAIQSYLQSASLPTPSAYMSLDEYGVLPAAILAERHGTRPIPLPSAAVRRNNLKSEFRAWCAEHGVRGPACVSLLTPEDDLETLLREAGITFPVVCKPNPGAGSLLCQVADSMEQLRTVVAHTWHHLGTFADAVYLEASLGQRMHILIEEYVGGQEVDLDVIVEHGVIRFCAISDNFAPPPPWCIEVGGCTPSRLPAHAQAKLLHLFHDFVNAHGASLHGVLHFEAKFDFARDEAFVIENNCRPGSAETTTMIETCYGVNLSVILTRRSGRCRKRTRDAPHRLTCLPIAAVACYRATCRPPIQPSLMGCQLQMARSLAPRTSHSRW